MSNFGAVIVAYNPDENLMSLVTVLSTVLCSDNIVVVDNSTQQTESIENLRLLGHKVWLMSGNEGIAAALNAGIAWLLTQGCDSFFCFDQDSKIDKNFIIKMIDTWKSISEEKIGILCPTFYDVNSKTRAKFTKIDGWRITNFEADQLNRRRGKLIETSFAITSGSLLSRSGFIKSGGFDENLFIDHVDSEFCLRLADKGYKILVDPNIEFHHSVGHRTKEKLWFLTIKPNNHAPIRRYYIFRNGIITQNRYYRKYPGFIILNFARNIHEFLSVAFFEDNKMRKFDAMMLGIRDGLLNRMGKNEELWKKFSS